MYFKFIFNVKVGYLQLMVFSVCMCSDSCIMAWWWPESRVEAGCHLIKLFAKCVLVVIENTDRYYDCYTKGDVSYKEW